MSEGAGTAYINRKCSRLQEKYWPGRKLKIRKDDFIFTDGGIRRKVRKIKEYEVVKLFRHHVSCVDQYGQRESFGYYELESIAG